jgi:hypothetical protein
MLIHDLTAKGPATKVRIAYLYSPRPVIPMKPEIKAVFQALERRATIV